MSVPVKSTSLQAYHVVLYNRALHPELLPLKARRVVRHGAYELELWIMNGAHLLRFEHSTLCSCELVTAQEGQIPEAGVVTAFQCVGEHEFEHQFKKDKVTYMTSVQTEQLSENLFIATFDEMLDYGRQNDALIHRWDDDTGRCLSVIDVQRFSKEVHAQCYHLVAQGGLVLRTQTIYEHV